jgi:hypothetical protein
VKAMLIEDWESHRCGPVVTLPGSAMQPPPTVSTMVRPGLVARWKRMLDVSYTMDYRLSDMPILYQLDRMEAA